MEAITREEMFLSDIAGESDFGLEPITRKEKFLDKIAKNGGGGGGISSWNDLSGTIPPEKLPEGYPYAEEGMVAILEEGKYTSSYNSTYGAFTISIMHYLGYVPQKITVNYEGNAYKDLQVNFINDQLGNLAGNLGLMNSIMGTNFPNTGEPFIVALTEKGGIILVTDIAPTEHNIGIETFGEIVHKIDKKFLFVHIRKNQYATLEEIKNENVGERYYDSDISYAEMENIWLNGGAFYLDIESERGYTKRYFCLESIYDPDNEVVLLRFDIDGKIINISNKSVSSDAYD